MGKEQFAHCLSGPVSLAEDQWRERDVDRLHALAASQVKNADRAARQSHLASLGVSLIAVKAANRADEYARAVAKLAQMVRREARPRPSNTICLSVSRQAIQEYVVDFCPTCSGKGEVPDLEGLEGAQRMKPCPECGGHGKRRYSDSERAEAIGAENEKRAAYLISRANYLISMAEDEAIRGARRLLERW